MHHYCTYFNGRYLQKGLAMIASLSQHAGPHQVWVLCLDARAEEALRLLQMPQVHIIPLSQFEDGDIALQEAKKNRSEIEYFFTCSPSLPLWILHHHPEIQDITYLDADLFFFADPEPVFVEMGDASVLIIDHHFSAAVRHLEVYGRYNVGWLTFCNTADGLRVLEDWRQKCLEWCRDELDGNRFADQKYLDAWPAAFAGIRVSQHAGANLAPWNVGDADLQTHAGSVTVNGQPLLFYHFHGLHLLSRWLADPQLAQYHVPLTPVLVRSIYRPYLRALRRAAGVLQAAGISSADTQGTPRNGVAQKSEWFRLLREGKLIVG